MQVARRLCEERLRFLAQLVYRDSTGAQIVEAFFSLGSAEADRDAFQLLAVGPILRLELAIELQLEAQGLVHLAVQLRLVLASFSVRHVRVVLVVDLLQRALPALLLLLLLVVVTRKKWDLEAVRGWAGLHRRPGLLLAWRKRLRCEGVGRSLVEGSLLRVYRGWRGTVEEVAVVVEPPVQEVLLTRLTLIRVHLV